MNSEINQLLNEMTNVCTQAFQKVDTDFEKITDENCPLDLAERIREIYKKCIDIKPQNPFGIPTKNIECENVSIGKLLQDYKKVVLEGIPEVEKTQKYIEQKQYQEAGKKWNNIMKYICNACNIQISCPIQITEEIENRADVFLTMASVGEVKFPIFMSMIVSKKTNKIDEKQAESVAGHEIGHLLYRCDEGFRKSCDEKLNKLKPSLEERILKFGQKHNSTFQFIQNPFFQTALFEINKTANGFKRWDTKNELIAQQSNKPLNKAYAKFIKFITIPLKLPLNAIARPLNCFCEILDKSSKGETIDEILTKHREELGADIAGAVFSSPNASINFLENVNSQRKKGIAYYTAHTTKTHPLDNTRINRLKELTGTIETYQNNLKSSISI